MFENKGNNHVRKQNKHTRACSQRRAHRQHYTFVLGC